MKATHLLYLWPVFLLPVMLCAQETPVSKQPPLEQVMRDNIRHLKQGALLVRLQTRENSIAAMRKAGQEAQAKELEKQQAEYNRNIISAFRSQFRFCPVYFFFSTWSSQIIAGNTREVVFLNDSLQPDPAIALNGKKFLTAEFGILQADTATFYQGHYLYYGGKDLESRNSYSGAADQKLPVLRIMDEKFLQLTDPFPFYVRTYTEQPNLKKMNKAVSKMNGQLSNYYSLNN